MRRRFATLAAVFLTAVAVWSTSGVAAAASAGPRVDIVKVSGLIDSINADLLSHSLHRAATERATLLVWQINSTGGTISAPRLGALLAEVKASPVPVAGWVGGSGRPRAYGAAYVVLRALDFTGEGPSSRVGYGPGRLLHSSMSGDDAVDASLLDVAEPTIVDFLGSISGHTYRGVTIDLGVTGRPGTPGRGFRKDAQFAFSQLSIVPKLLHTAASPDVAFVMLLIALSLAVFEFFTAGVGVAAGTGIVFGILSAYGLGVLPTHPWAVALLCLSVLGFAIDVQAGAPRFWTAAGALLYVAGSLGLYGGGHSVSLWIVVGMGLLLALFMVSGMPAMVRTRFSTPTIGRESMIGSMGVAVSGVAPEGTVRIDGAPWRARTNRATPIGIGDSVRVVGIDGLLLEVEPELGGARDAGH